MKQDVALYVCTGENRRAHKGRQSDVGSNQSVGVSYIMAKPILTAARLRELFHYDPETGVFTRRVKVRQYGVGSVCGFFSGDQYLRIRVSGQTYLCHRLAWLHVTGEWPVGSIDHIDGNPANNRIANLREVGHQTNLENRRRPNKNNRAGFLGVSLHRAGWVAQIASGGRVEHIGVFPTPEQAHEAYVARKRVLHRGSTL